MKKLAFLIIVVGMMSCSGSGSERPASWIGEWKATWSTPPDAYPGMGGMTFEMNGSFVFDSDSLTVAANGFDGCIFHADTLVHTQGWHVSNDTLFLVNEPGSLGMTYTIKAKSDDQIKLQLLDDIFVTLEK